jgi:quercetin dioxygenase-like cupin family protein
VLKGQLDYRHGNEVYTLRPGDALTFQGDIPHGPERLAKVPIQLLSIIHYGQDET